MYMLSNIFKYEWLNFTRNKFQVFIIVLTFLLGVFAIYYGNVEVNDQKKTLDEMAVSHRKQIETILTRFDSDTTNVKGKQDYETSAHPAYARIRHTYPAMWHPSVFTPLALGQRDIHQYYYNLSGLMLYYQLFQNEIANPQKLLVGNLDLSFILIYIFPLLIIAFSYSILSGEKDLGVLPLLNIQEVPLRKILILKFLFYFLLILSLGIFLSILGFLALRINLIENCLQIFFWLLTVSTYFSLWFSVLYLIVSFNRTSAFNAIAGIGLWLLFLIIIPATLNIIVSVIKPVNSTELSDITRRIGPTNDEDLSVYREFIKRYLKAHPEWNVGDSSYEPNVVAKGYAAFNQLTDRKYEGQVRTYQNQILEREEFVRKLSIINPAVTAQGIFNTIAKSDLLSYFDFYHSILPFHQSIVDFYYPKLFQNQKLTKADYDGAPEFKISINQHRKDLITKELFQLFYVSVILSVWAFLRFKRQMIS